MRTDIHAHIFHPRTAAKALARIASVGFNSVGTGVIDDLLPRAARAGVKRVVAHIAALSGDQVVAANNFALALLRNQQPEPDRDAHSEEVAPLAGAAPLAENASMPRMVPFGSVHPDCLRWPRELDRLEKSGVKGIKLHPNFQNLAFDDPRLFPIMEAVGTRFILMCHVGCEPPLEKNPASPYKLRALIEHFPKARIIAAHMGGYANGTAALDALAGRDIWLDTSNTHALALPELRAILKAHPRERILFGSDYPLYDPAEEIPLQQRRLGLSDPEMEALLHNADALLGA